MLLSQLLQTTLQARSLPARCGQGRRLQAPAQLGPGRLDDRLGQDRGRDGGEDLALDALGWAAAGMAIWRRASVVTDLGAALDMRLTPEPGAAGADKEAPEGVAAVRRRLVAGPGAGPYRELAGSAYLRPISPVSLSLGCGP